MALLLKFSKILVLFLATVAQPNLVSAQPGVIALYWDRDGTTCYLSPTPGLCYSYVIHEGTSAANASQWMVEIQNFTARFMAYNTAPYLNILSQPLSTPPLDSPLGGISIAYGNRDCEPLPAVICTISWFCTGAEPICSGVRIVADPMASIAGIEVRDCGNNPVEAMGLPAWVDPTNGSSGCSGCDADPRAPNLTWGQIKTLYD